MSEIDVWRTSLAKYSWEESGETRQIERSARLFRNEQCIMTARSHRCQKKIANCLNDSQPGKLRSYRPAECGTTDEWMLHKRHLVFPFIHAISITYSQTTHCIIPLRESKNRCADTKVTRIFGVGPCLCCNSVTLVTMQVWAKTYTSYLPDRHSA